MAYKVFSNGSTLPASDINDNLMNQSVIVFSNAAARTAAITSPLEGMLTWLEDVNRYESYNGTAWVPAFALTHITTQTIGSAVTSVVVSNVFSATYDCYRILVNNTVGSVDNAMRLSYNNSSGSTYAHNGNYYNWGNTAFFHEAGTALTSTWIGNIQNGNTNIMADIYNPFLATQTYHQSFSLGASNPVLRYGRDTSAVSNTGFTMTPNAGNLTGGTISVYGYKKG